MLINIKDYKYFYSIAANNDYSDFCNNDDVVNFVTIKLNKEMTVDENSTDEEDNKYADRYNDILYNFYEILINEHIEDFDVEIEV
jgi:hypothetical protein